MKKRHLGLAAVGLLAVGFYVGNQIHPLFPPLIQSQKDKRVKIYPTIYITGSSGKISSIDPIVKEMVSDKGTKAQRGLEIIYNDNGSLTISGKANIHRGNEYPTIEVGMQTGTNNSTIYTAALKEIMKYLNKTYNMPYANVMGYSAGGSGIYRYLMTYNNKPTVYSKIKKFVSLDGQYNASTAQPNQTLNDVLANGPKIKSKYYQYWEDGYTKVAPDIQALFLAGDYNHAEQTDGTVPWADTFSVYHYWIKNKNLAQYYIFEGENTKHSEVPSNKQAQNLIKIFFYE
jgi:uncharacterized alpha/beta hydrolase family protein